MNLEIKPMTYELIINIIRILRIKSNGKKKLLKKE